MGKPWEISSDDIAEWSERNAAAGKLPELVRRLLHATVPLQALEMRADGGVRLRGWDGLVVARTERLFCPRGPSGWEVSVRVDKKKLDDDFDKRTKTPSPLLPLTAAYVVVSARRYTNKIEWVAAKKALGIWSDVRLLDADDLAAWLEQAPAVARWFAREIGRPVEGFTDIDTFLEAWSRRTAPYLPAAVAIAGRDREAAALRGWLERPVGAPLVLRADTQDEALVFAAAAIAGSPSPTADRWRARALVVDSIDAFRWALTAQQTEPLILLPRFDGFEAGEAAGKAYVIVPVDASASARTSTGIELDRIPRPDLAAALISGGIDPQEAETLARESGGKLGVLQRLCGHTMLPEWAESAPRGPLVAMLFAGAWEEKNPADREVIARLGAKPEEVEALCTDLLRRPDAPIVRKDAAWAWVAPGDAWRALASELTRTQLEVFEKVTIDVLGAADPSYELPVKERMYAVLQDKVLPQSPALRQGLAESIVRLSLSDPELLETYGLSSGSRLADHIVVTLLKPEWTRWASLAELLPLLAEASPREFMVASDRSLDRNADGLSRLFAEEGNFGGPHTGLLWALETLGWHPDWMPRVADSLARLAARDPGGTLANRPATSLSKLIHVVLPQTMAPRSERLAVLKKVFQRHPGVGWTVVLGMLENLRGGLIMPARRPLYLPWKLPLTEEAPDAEEFHANVAGVVELVLEQAAAEKSAARWASLLGVLWWLPNDLPLHVLDNLATATEQTDNEARRVLQEAVRSAEYFAPPVEEVPLGVEIRSRLAMLREAFEPTSIAARISWLFGSHPDLPYTADDTAEADVEARRDDALKALWASDEHWDLLAELARSAEDPEAVGETLGRAPFADEAELKLIEASADGPYAALVPLFFATRVLTKGFAWLEGRFAELVRRNRAQDVVRIARRLPPSTSLWDTLVRVGDSVHLDYWRSVGRIFGLESRDEWERAVTNLIAAARPAAAVRAAADSRGKVSTATALGALEQLRDSPPSEEVNRTRNDTLAPHYFEQLFTAIDRDPAADLQRVVGLERDYFQFLERTRRSLKQTFHVLEEHPDEFVKLVCTIYRAEGEPPLDESQREERQARALADYQILSAWKLSPGAQLPAEEREEILSAWAVTATELSVAAGRKAGGIHEVAKVLARAPVADDGTWPCRAAREILEFKNYEGLDRELRTAKLNRRGTYAKKLGEGGAQERELSANFRASAEKLRSEWPRTAMLLDGLSRDYERQGEEEDLEAREDQLTYGIHPSHKPSPVAPPPSEPPGPVAPTSAPIPFIREMQVTLVVENYRALRRVRWTLPRGVSALVGPNGSGKTTLLDVPEFLRHAIEHDVRTAVDERGGPGNLRSFQADRGAPVVVGVELDSLSWQIDLAPKGAAFNPLYGEKATIAGALALDRSTPVPGLDVPSYDARPLLPRFSELTAGAALRPLVALLKGYRLYGTYDLANIRMNGSQVSSDEHLHPDGRNIFSVLRNWRDRKETRPRWEFVITSLKEGFPDTFDDLDFDMAGQTVSGRIVAPQPDVSFSTYFAANGWLIALLHLAAVASTEPACAVAIDEVENGLHPYAIRALIDAMRRWAEQTGISIVLATHSPVVLDQFKEEPDHLFVMESGREPLPIRLDEMHDPEWLAHFSLGDLYAHDEFGAQHKDGQRVA